MDNFFAPNDNSIDPPNRGFKRKATSTTAGTIVKRFRRIQTPTDSDSDPSNYNLDPASDADEDHCIISSVSTLSTPSTPISPKAPPRHPSDVLKIHRCTYADCGKSFNRPAKLAQHLRSHTNTRPFLCPHTLCTKDFLRESHLKHHIKSAHSNIRDYTCEWEGCGKSFVNATRLKRHHGAHEGREKFRCTVAGCGQAFRKHGTLQKHILNLHEGRKLLTCNVLDFDGIECGASFDTEGQLKSHTGRVHESNTYLCTICPAESRSTIAKQMPENQNQETRFLTHAALRKHIESEHPPACTECGQKSKSLQDLKNHLEVIHGSFNVNDSKAYLCHEQGFGRSFRKTGNPSMHIRINHDPSFIIYGGNGQDGAKSCGETLINRARLEESTLIVHQDLAPTGKNSVPDKHHRKGQVSVLTRLTGAGYEELGGRDISCPVIGCTHRFLRQHDQDVHLRSYHGLTRHGPLETLMDEMRPYRGQALQEAPLFGTKEDFDAQSALDVQSNDVVDMNGRAETLGAGALMSGNPWLEGQSYIDRRESGEWFHDELEMRFLIDDGMAMERHEIIDGQELDVVDPALG